MVKWLSAGVGNGHQAATPQHHGDGTEFFDAPDERRWCSREIDS
jgi:hypothetical protein